MRIIAPLGFLLPQYLHGFARHGPPLVATRAVFAEVGGRWRLYLRLRTQQKASSPLTHEQRIGYSLAHKLQDTTYTDTIYIVYGNSYAASTIQSCTYMTQDARTANRKQLCIYASRVCICAKHDVRHDLHIHNLALRAAALWWMNTRVEQSCTYMNPTHTYTIQPRAHI